MCGWVQEKGIYIEDEVLLAFLSELEKISE